MTPSSLVEYVLHTSVMQTWVTYGFLIMWSHVVQMHLLAVLCYLLRIHPLVDFWVDVCLSLALQDLLRVVSWALVDRYRLVFTRLLRPLFHAPPKKRKHLKSLVLVGVTFYVVVAVRVGGVNEDFLTLAALQVLACHLIRVFVLPIESRRYFTHQIELLAFRACPNTRVLEKQDGEEHIQTDHFSSPPSTAATPLTALRERALRAPAPSLRKRARDGAWSQLKRARRKLMRKVSF